MIYLLGVALPAALQVLIVWILIAANSGNGSFIGLGAMLLGLIAIPATAIANWVYLQSQREKPAGARLLRCFGIAALTPILVLMWAAVG